MSATYREDPETFDADAYRVQGYEGVAWRILGWNTQQVYEEEEYDCPNGDCREGYDELQDRQCGTCEGSGSVYRTSEEAVERDTGMIVAVMVGDDRKFVLDAGDITPIAREDYCGQCGQIGCTHDGLERE